jgi:transcription initiation factor TFIIIB Brf1 subunit/transcription initiation factor TFIIB
MIYTTLDTFYVSHQQMLDSPSRRDGVDENVENLLRIYGCEIIQECGILLKLPQAVMATGQVLFHRFYCKKSFTRFNVRSVAASCVWLAAKLEESPKEISAVLQVLWRMERRRNNLPIEVLDLHSPVCSITQIAPLSFSSDVYYSAFTSLGTKFEPQYALQKYLEMKTALIRTERHLLKEMGFICHVEHPHKFIMSYLKALEAPVELMQEAWNLANDR